MRRKLFISLVGLILFSVLGTYVVLETPVLLTWVIRFHVGFGIKDLKINELKINDSGFVKGFQYLIKDARAVVEVSGKKILLDFTIDQIILENPLAGFLGGDPLTVHLEDVDCASADSQLEIQGLTARMEGRAGFRHWSGWTFMRQLRWQKYTLENVSSDFFILESRISLANLDALVSGAKLAGAIELEYSPRLKYSADIQFNGLDLDRIEHWQPALLSKIHANVDVDILAEGDSHQIAKIKGRVHAKENAQIQASVLQSLIQHIPDAQKQKRTRLQDLVIQNDLIPLYRADVHLLSSDTEKLVMHFDLKSKSKPLELNLTVELNIEGGLMSLLQVQTQILNF